MDTRGYDITPRPLCGPAIAAAFVDRNTVDLDALVSAAMRGETVTCGDTESALPLDWAIMNGRPDVARLLLEAGADPNARWGWRGDRFPLQDAIEWLPYAHQLRRRELIGLLLHHGADPNARWCPFESRAGIPRVVPGCTSDGGVTPLIAAASFDQADTTYLLLDAGADPALMDGQGFSALDYARGRAVFELILAARYPNPAERRTGAAAFAKNRPRSSWLLPPPPPPPSTDR